MKDEVFEEEEEQLSFAVDRIETEAAFYDSLADEKQKEALSYFATDYYDWESKHASLSEASKHWKTAEDLRDLCLSPYFSRYDVLVSRGSRETMTRRRYYVGKPPIKLDNTFSKTENLVYDARDMLFSTLRSREQAVIDGIRYELVLRRNLIIEYGVLSEYQDEVGDIDGSGKSSALGDPFLLKVVRQMRSRHELASILRTIQRRQNDIVIDSSGQSFIVQGCAGSGKTQVLLHRLSYLVYNNRAKDWSRSQIITVNKAFAKYLSGIARELEMDVIDRMSLEEYYMVLLDRISGSSGKEPTMDEGTLNNPAFLEEVYSESFRAKLHRKCTECWEAVFGKTKNPRITVLADRFDVSVPGINEYGQRFYSEWRKFGHTLKLRMEETEKRILDALESAENAQSRTLRRRCDAEAAEESLNASRDRALLALLPCMSAEMPLSDRESDTGQTAEELEYIRHQNDEEMQRIWLAIEAEERVTKEQLRDTDRLSEEAVAALEEYIVSWEKRRDALVDLVKAETEEKNRQERFEKAAEDEILPNDMALTELLIKEIERVRFESLWRSVVSPALTKLRHKHGVKLPKGSVMRHHLYLRLCVSLVYFGLPSSGKMENALYVDEAQEIAPSEYRLLREILGRGCIFELYGDIRQSTTEGRSVRSWEDVASVLDCTMGPELIENYRNTSAVTNFCNEELGMQMRSIGLEGPDILTYTARKAHIWLDQKAQKKSDERIALIVKNGDVLKDAGLDTEKLERIFESAAPFEIMTVEECKGREFECVMVFDAGLSENQRYVAYSRAVSELAVVRDEQ